MQKAINRNRFEDVERIFTAYLESKGNRKTPERYRILEFIYERDDHFDVDSLYNEIKGKNLGISRATVYNTLDLLVECDLVTKHQFGKNLTQYEKAYGYRQHDHLICTECHKVIEFCDPRIHNIQQTVGEVLGFDVLHHSLLLYANCKKVNCENRTDK